MKTLRKRPRPIPEVLAGVGAAIARSYAGYDPPLRFSWQRLDDGQAHELVELVKKADEEDGFGLNRLSIGDRRRVEQLVELGADKPGYFEQEREAQKMRVEFSELARKVALPGKRVRFEEPGSIRIPKEIFDDLDRPAPGYWLIDLALMTFFGLQLENAKPLTPGGTIEGSGDNAVIVVDLGLGLGAKYTDDGLAGWRHGLDHLGEVGWFTVEQRGRKLRISRGPRMLSTLKKAA